MSARSSRSPDWLAGNWVALGLWAGLAAAVARGGVLYVMDVLGHAAAPEVVRMRLAGALPSKLRARSRLEQGEGERARLGAWVLVVGGGAWAWLALWTGRLSGDVSRQVGMDTARGESVTQALLGAGALLALALVLAVGRAMRGAKVPSGLGALVPAALAVLLPAGWWLSYAAFLGPWSLFISELAFNSAEQIEAAKIGILAASGKGG